MFPIEKLFFLKFLLNLLSKIILPNIIKAKKGGIHMDIINIGNNIMKYRRQLGITQEQLAKYIGVSKSSVSKWETNTTYPDIVFLPQLAALFNVTLDELMGYQPQLTKEAIKKIYHELSSEIASNEKEVVFEKCENYIKKYNSCFPFLLQMANFYLNHSFLFQEKEVIYEKGIELCKRIENESHDSSLTKDAISLQAGFLVAANRPVEALELLGEQIKPFNQDMEIIGLCYQLLGNIEKATEVTQICLYQHLVFLLTDGCSYLIYNSENKEIAEETLKRLFGIMELFHIETLRPYTAVQIYLCAAQAYAAHGEWEKTLEMLERYCKACQNMEIILHGDDYFFHLDKWLNELELGTKAPTDPKYMKEAFLIGVRDNPLFDTLKKNSQFRIIVKKLEQL